MEQLRLVYRNQIIETVLLGAVGVQIISGLNLFFSKRRNTVHFFEKLQIWTGLYLAFFLVIHVGAVMVGRYFLNLFFLPYYGLAIIAFFGHLAAIHHQKMKRKILGFTVEQQSKIIFIKGIVITALIIYGLTNGFSGVQIPEDYNILSSLPK